MNYTDDNPPRPEPVPRGGSAHTDNPDQGSSPGQPYGSEYTEAQYYADRPGYVQEQYPPSGGTDSARYYQSSPQDGPYEPYQYGPPQQSAPHGSNGPHYYRVQEAPIPPEVRKWNWGAFMFNWIWGCGNGAYLSLFALIPVFRIAWWFVCGARGNVWAWKSGKFKDLDTFLTTQRTWNIAGLITFFICIGVVVLFILSIVLAWAPAYTMLEQEGYTDFGDYRWD